MHIEIGRESLVRGMIKEIKGSNDLHSIRESLEFIDSVMNGESDTSYRVSYEWYTTFVEQS